MIKTIVFGAIVALFMVSIPSSVHAVHGAFALRGEVLGVSTNFETEIQAQLLYIQSKLDLIIIQYIRNFEAQLAAVIAGQVF